MPDENQVELKLQELIQNTLNQRKLWEQRRKEAEQQIQILDAKLAAYQATLKNYWESINMKK